MMIFIVSRSVSFLSLNFAFEIVGFGFDKVREQGAYLNAEESIFWVGISDIFAGQISPFLCYYQTLWGNKRTGLSSYYSLLLFLLRLRVV